MELYARLSKSPVGIRFPQENVCLPNSVEHLCEEFNDPALFFICCIVSFFSFPAAEEPQRIRSEWFVPRSRCAQFGSMVAEIIGEFSFMLVDSAVVCEDGWRFE